MRRLLCLVCVVGVVCPGVVDAGAQSATNQSPTQPTTPSSPFSGLVDAFSDEYSRLTTGVESLSRSASVGTQHFLLDFMLSAPLAGDAVSRTTKPAWEAWFNARFSGAPNSSATSVKQFVGGFEDALIGGELKSLVNALSFRAGVERPMSNGGPLFLKAYQLQVAAIAAVGITTVPALDKPAIFELTEEARQRFAVPKSHPGSETPITYIGFTEPDRRRFYPRWEVGLRLKTHHFANCEGAGDGCDPHARVNFPGMIDLSVGQDASVTGGQMRGQVYGLDAFYPLPTDSLANAIYLFGRVRYHRLKDIPVEVPPIILRAPSATVKIPSDDLWIHVLSPDERTRDDWKFGVGVDLVRLFAGAAAGRDKDKAAELPESGFSRATLLSTDEVEVLKLLAQSGERATFDHVEDFFLPTTAGQLRVQPATGNAASERSFARHVLESAVAMKARYTNIGDQTFETLLIRVKPRPAAERELGTWSDKTTAAQTVQFGAERSALYRISRLSCKADCVVLSDADTSDQLIIVPLSGETVTVTVADKTVPWIIDKPIAVGRKTKLEITSQGNAEFVAMRLR